MNGLDKYLDWKIIGDLISARNINFPIVAYYDLLHNRPVFKIKKTSSSMCNLRDKFSETNMFIFG
jgi:hypothetical protein